MIVAFSLLTIPMAWIGTDLRDQAQQSKAIELVEKLGGSVESKSRLLYGKTVTGIDLSDSDITDEDLKSFLCFDALEMLDLMETEISDQDEVPGRNGPPYKSHFE